MSKVDRLSIGRVKLFKACRRAYELRYIYNLVPVEKAEALETGLTYHSKLEELYKTGEVDTSDFSKESAMALAYKKYIYPKFKVKSVEDWFTYLLPNGAKLIGRTDGITESGELVEHKTCSAEIGEDYEYGLQWDEQIPAYMLATGARRVWYTVCRKPTIKQKKCESDEEFFFRMVAWYEEDTDSKIKLLKIERTEKEIAEFLLDLRKTIHDMESCTHFYKNCAHCQKWGRRCEYSSICLHYDPSQEYIEFKKREDVTNGIGYEGV